MYIATTNYSSLLDIILDYISQFSSLTILLLYAVAIELYYVGSEHAVTVKHCLAMHAGHKIHMQKLDDTKSTHYEYVLYTESL